MVAEIKKQVEVVPVKIIEIRMWCDNTTGCEYSKKPAIFTPKDFPNWPFLSNVWRCGKCGSSARMGCFEVETKVINGKEEKVEWKFWGCGVLVFSLCMTLSSIF